MPASILIAIKGYQDSYITSKPEITFFKKIYKRYSNFALECMPQQFNITPDFGTRVTCTISKNADLISKMYLVVDLPPIGKFIDYIGDSGTGNSKIAACAWCKNIGFQLIKSVELEIGGKIIDRHYSDWLNIWSELTTSLSKKRGLDKMIGNVQELTQFSNGKKGYRLYIPLMFYFCRNPSLALPIIALSNADVKVNIEFNTLDNCLILAPSHYIYIIEDIVNLEKNDILMQTVLNVNYYVRFIYFDILDKRLYYVKITPEAFDSSTPIISTTSGFTITPSSSENLYLDKNRYFPNTISLSLSSATLLVDYIYVDINERLKFSKTNHTYIIDTLQFDNDKIIYHSNNKIKLGYNNSCKELIFRGQYEYFNNGYSLDVFNYTSYDTTTIIKNATLLLNGQERISSDSSKFFELLQVFNSHTSSSSPGIYCYSFSLKPEDLRITGTCNLSKMDDIVLQISVDTGVSYNRPMKIRVYAVTLNVLKIINGVCTLEF